MTKLSDDFHNDMILIQNGEAVPNRYDTLPLPQPEETTANTNTPDPYRRVILIGGPEA